MKAHVSMGWDRTYTLEHAVLVYRARDRAIATVHGVQEMPDGGAPVLGPGRPVSPDFLRELSRGLGNALPLEVLPVHVLARTADQVTWWVPPARRVMFFDTKDPDVAAVSGRTFPHPALVCKLEGRDLSIRALATAERPTAATPLMVAPYWNTDSSARVCQGSMRVPERVTLETLDLWVATYFNSAFTHPSGAVRLTSHPGGFVGLWGALADQDIPFPAEYLTPAGETLLEFVRGSA